MTASLLGEAPACSGGTGEAHVPTKQPSPVAAARIPAPHADPRWSRDPADAAAERACPPLGMIGRVRDRGTFESLRRDGRRARRGPVTVTYLPAHPGSDSTRVAYGISRKVGGAVVRNRTRRRLRAILHDLDRGPDGLRPGTYLLTARPDVVDVDYGHLADLVADACSASARPPGEPAR